MIRCLGFPPARHKTALDVTSSFKIIRQYPGLPDGLSKTCKAMMIHEQGIAIRNRRDGCLEKRPLFNIITNSIPFVPNHLIVKVGRVLCIRHESFFQTTDGCCSGGMNMNDGIHIGTCGVYGCMDNIGSSFADETTTIPKSDCWNVKLVLVHTATLFCHLRDIGGRYQQVFGIDVLEQFVTRSDQTSITKAMRNMIPCKHVVVVSCRQAMSDR